MPASRDEVRERLLALFGAWADDPESDVVAVEEVDGRVAVRMRQTVRDFSTIWCDPGERTIRFEVYVLPAPPGSAAEIHRQALVRNAGLRDAAFALDDEGAVVIVARIPTIELSDDRLQLVVAELWEGVERAFPSMVRLAFAREK
ncbi:MAG: hypothetical protein AB1Z57_05800 [Acidimicrobiia bacterium]